jgi:lysophospholipid acyltransferase (LPLAT)-like uncharacterized protein
MGPRAETGARARDADAALASSFRRRWTWWTQLRVVVLGAILAAVMRVLYATMRVRWTDGADVLARHSRGERFIFASWHEGLLLLPLIMTRRPARFRPRILVSWHRDAEIGTQAARHFGVHGIRGSSTRGRIGAIRGLLSAHRAGEDVVIIPDGPRGPRGEAKDGVAQLARATGVGVVPIGVVAAPCHRLHNWCRLQIPLPFSRVAIRFGADVPVTDDVAGDRARIQTALETAVAAAAAMVGVAGTAP